MQRKVDLAETDATAFALKKLEITPEIPVKIPQSFT
jgi:hypothetical protein